MANETIILALHAATPWDGGSPTQLRRDDATVTGQRYYRFDIAGAHGVLDADLGGLFSPVSMKLVGVAYSSWSPESKARVIASDAAGTPRQEVTLGPEVQHVLMYPGDRLALLTRGGGGQVMLSVNELTEHEAVLAALAHGPKERTTRFRIVRRTGAPFATNLAAVWQPDFTYDPATGLLVAEDDGTGMIPATSLCLYPRHHGCFVSIRFAGSAGASIVHVVNGLTRKSLVAHAGLADVRWSRVQYISHDDGIALEAPPWAAGQPMICDIEVARVHPGDRLAGLYYGGM